ncbi:MAG: penicillin-binding protein activator LpoB [Kiritimatiellae bacterium]|nr:penicillin-binding protein activator LpoB [Kiritimatiellia bacterium]
MKAMFLPVAGSMVLMVVTGCATAPHVYESELDRAPMTSRIEPQDIRRTVEKMAESLISDAGVLEATGGKRPILDIEPMQNRSQLIVDMKSITDSVRTRLIRSRLFRFVDRSTAGADIAIMDEQAQLGLTDPRKAVKPGRQSAAEMYLTGSLTDMVTHAGRVTDHYYKFTMILKDLRTGEIVWTDEQEIRKVALRPML